MKRQILTTGITLGMLMILAQPVLAQPNMEKGGKADKGMNLKTELNLSPQQEAQMQSLRLDLEKRMIPLKAELETRKLEMKELNLAEKPNKKKLLAQIDEINVAKVKMDKEKLEHRLAVREILTPEQQKVFAQKQMKRGKKSKCGERDDRKRRHHNRQDRF